MREDPAYGVSQPAWRSSSCRSQAGSTCWNPAQRRARTVSPIASGDGTPGGVLPRLWQVPLWQLVPVWVQVLFAQQGWPAAPHVWQVPLTQTALAWQVLPAQHGWLPSPQVTHIPPWQTALA
ncbi:MAG: hypothetical protein AB7U18_08390 [Dehalococcoidia bacterium]